LYDLMGVATREIFEIIMNKIRVLVVDDHTILRDGIRALLGVDDAVEIVGEAADGNEAVEKASALTPEVIIMDIAMPGLDGLEATRRILKQNPAIRILILSQYDDKKYILSAMKAGAAGYVSKRVLGKELVGAIHALHEGGSYLHPSVARTVIEGLLSNNEADPYDQLTAREREILKLLADGQSSREIADSLSISLKTVLGHRAKLMAKLDLHNRTDLIRYAMRKGLVEPES
jgi:DNA-binding NarL/FixJ family response regulator